MSELPSPGSAFSKLQSLFLKLIPILGVFLGMFSIRFIGGPIAKAIQGVLQKRLGVGKGSGTVGVTKGDFNQLMWWIPTGLILAFVAGAIGMFIKSSSDGDFAQVAGNFALGLAVGFFLGALIMPFREDIPIIGKFLTGG